MLALGTYYTKHALRNWAGEIHGANDVSAWVYHVKEWWAPEAIFRHPNHSDNRKFIINNPSHACWYAAGVGKTLITEAFEDLDFPPAKTLLIPIPSSDITRATNDGRWPALRLARALEKTGVGTVLPKLYFKRQRPAKHSDQGSAARDDATPLFKDLDVDERIFLPPWANVIYVDDVLTWGTHMAATHEALGRPKKVMGFTVGSTDSGRVTSALDPRYRLVKYDYLECVTVVEAPDAT